MLPMLILGIVALTTLLVVFVAVQVFPSATQAQVIADQKSLKFMDRRGTPNEKYGADLEKLFVTETKKFQDRKATSDTDAEGDIVSIDLTQFDDIEWVQIYGQDLATPLQLHWHEDAFLLEFSDLSGALTLGETLTGGTSGATVKLLAFKSPGGGLNDFVQVLLLAGTPDPGGEIWTGGTSTETFTSTDGGILKTRWISARIFVNSTGASHDSQTDVPFRWRVKGILPVA